MLLLIMTRLINKLNMTSSHVMLTRLLFYFF